MRRLVAILALAGLGVLLAAPGAAAHASLRSSEPADGARLERAPEAVRLTFTERPELSLSVVRVLDSVGTAYERGRPRAVPGDPLALHVPVRTLPTGAYTVSWRVVSAVDGHATAGAFAFGVGVAPSEAPASAVLPSTPPPSLLEMAGRWVFFVGLVGLLGGAWAGAAVFGGSPVAVRRQSEAGWLAAIAGVVLLAEAQRRAAAASLGDLFATELGRAILWRAAAVVVAGAALLVSRTGDRRRRLVALWVAGIAAAGAMLAHVEAGHAAASGSLRWGKVATQWAHFAAVGVWIGGLVALLLGTRGAPSGEKAAAARRFSAVAGVALVVVAGTGILRAVNEVDSWGALASTGYGRVVLVKSGLLLVIAALGALNRFRNVPAASTSLSGLRRVSSSEIGLAVVALGAAAVLASLAPPAPARAARPAAVAAGGSDFATSVRVRLEVQPGVPGVNRFVARVTDFDTGEPVRADRVSLRFAFLDDPAVGGSSLPLARAADGTYRGRGVNLSIEGRWRVTVLVERGADSVAVPLELTLRGPPQRVTVNRVPGQPTLYTVELAAGGSVQIYTDPERPGRSELHVTFFDDAGTERPIEQITVSVTPPAGRATAVTVRRFSTGHFVADLTVREGRTRIAVRATAADGTALRADVAIEVAR